jgi:hypothetical protein
MSRKLLMVAALAAIALPVATARAQMGFGAAAGLSAPMGSFKDAVDAGYHVTGIVNFAAPLAPIGFRGEVSFNQFNFKSSPLGPSNAKENIVSGTANVVVSPPGMGLYGIGGLGIYHSSASCSGCSSNSLNKVGFNAGAGFKFGLTGFSAFVEARYHHTTTAGGTTAFVPISFGLIF